MKIVYKIGDFPDPGDRDVYNGIQEINKNNYREALKHFEKGSTYDNEYALLFSAIIYYTGFGLEKREPGIAMNLFKRVATDWKNPVAQYLVGEMYFNGEGVPEDKKSSFHWISLAAESGWPDAIAKMGDMYSSGYHVKKDHKKAIAWFEKLAKNDDCENEIIKDETFYLFGNKDFELDFTHANHEATKVAQLTLKQCLFSPARIRPTTYEDKAPHFDDFQRALIWNLLTKKESSGVVVSQAGLCYIYLEGESNVPVDYLKSLYWAKMAGNNEHVSSCALVGTLYFSGIGGKRDYAEAMKWVKKNIALGGTDGFFFIGLMYYKALGVERDCKTALTYFQALTDNKEDANSFYIMGEINQDGGDGVLQNSKAACAFYEKAFQLGNPMAATRIAAIHCKGLGMTKDKKKTTEWLQKAALHGCSTALSLIALIKKVGFKAAEPSILAVLDKTPLAELLREKTMCFIS